MTLARLVSYFYFDRLSIPRRKHFRPWGCKHKRTTFPQKPKGRREYVVCLDCGQEMSYDWAQMKMGGEIR
jgi:hypothetical protein